MGIVVFALVVAILKKRGILNFGSSGADPYYVKKPLTQPEQILYHRLVHALPDNIVLAQVQASRILGVKKGANFQEWNNRINRMSYDFVVCSKDSTVLAAIELDDKSHEADARVKTDAKKSKASTDAGLRLIRWHVRSLPSEEEIRSQIFVPLNNETPNTQFKPDRLRRPA